MLHSGTKFKGIKHPIVLDFCELNVHQTHTINARYTKFTTRFIQTRYNYPGTELTLSYLEAAEQIEDQIYDVQSSGILRLIWCLCFLISSPRRELLLEILSV
jgi:hypothetical protein